jgi:hypothetical protein
VAALFTTASVLCTESSNRPATNAKVVAVLRITFQSSTAGQSAVSANLAYHRSMAAIPVGIRSLYSPRKGRVEFVDVPEFTIVAVDGVGAPGSVAFQQAV